MTVLSKEGDDDIGFIYVIENDCYISSSKPKRKLYKIGLTKNVKQRLRDLNTTGVPKPFILLRCIKFHKHTKVEKHLHNILVSDRENPKREFFNTELPRIYDIINSYISTISNYEEMDVEKIDDLVIKQDDEEDDSEPEEDDTDIEEDIKLYNGKEHKIRYVKDTREVISITPPTGMDKRGRQVTLYYTYGVENPRFRAKPIE